MSLNHTVPARNSLLIDLQAIYITVSKSSYKYKCIGTCNIKGFFVTSQNPFFIYRMQQTNSKDQKNSILVKLTFKEYLLL